MDPVNDILDTVAPRRVEPKVIITAAVATTVVVGGVLVYRKFFRKDETIVEIVTEPAE